MDARFLDMGDRAFTVEVGDAIDMQATAAVGALDAAIASGHQAGGFRGLINTTRTFRSLTVHYDPLIGNRKDLEAAVRQVLDAEPQSTDKALREWILPVSYAGDDAPDLQAVAQACGMSADAVIEVHTTTRFLVYMLGFLPGFPFMGDLPENLRLPRRTEPRVRVPAGAVAIAGQLSAIYPWESPGGWHLIGRCPVPLFSASRETPALLGVGDRVGFKAESSQEVDALGKAIAAAEVDPASFCRTTP